MAFNTPQEALLQESSNIFYGEHHAMYPRDLQAGNCVMVGSFIYSHRDMQGKRFIKFLSHLIGYKIIARWEAGDEKPEKGKERLCLWHVESDGKDKKQVALESMYNMNQRKLFPLGYKRRFLFDVKESIGIDESTIFFSVRDATQPRLTWSARNKLRTRFCT
jgi:hypothetical protein